MPARIDRLNFWSYDGKTELQLAQGKDCVMLLIRHPDHGGSGIVVTSDEANAIASSLRRRAQYSRENKDG